MAEISANNKELGDFLGGVFDELEALFGELLRQQKALQSERQRAESELERERAELLRQQADLQALRDGILADIRSEAARATASGGQGGALQKALADAEQDRRALHAALADAQTQLAQLAQASADISAIRQELKQWTEQQGRAQAEALQAGSMPMLEERLMRVEEERAALDRERAVLAAELESLRARAVEMAESLDQQNRQIGEERARWTDEIERFRQLLEMMSLARAEMRQAASGTGARGTAAPGTEPAACASTASPDTTLDSIIAQFELLQKDAARRRRHVGNQE